MTDDDLGVARASHVSASALIDELVRSGVGHFCICPGSRSTPLAVAVADHPSARLWMHLDERSSAFFALGLARTLRDPVGVVCTSGTAAANCLPAVVEAFYARVPLVVLTADRPQELRDRGANQAIDQLRLFGAHVKWFFDLEGPWTAHADERHVRSLACRAAATARGGPPGPVHLNCPYREPLFADAAMGRRGDAATRRWRERDDERERGREGEGEGAMARPYVMVDSGPRVPDGELVARLVVHLAGERRGLIVCGPQDDPELAEAVVGLAAALDYPVLADPLSGVRCGPHDRGLVLDCYDAVLRSGDFVDGFEPRVVIRFGAMPTSKQVLLYLEHYPDCRQIVVDGHGGWRDPTALATDMLHVDGRLFCEALGTALARNVRFSALEGAKAPTTNQGPLPQGEAVGWALAWQAADRLAREAIRTRLADLDELFEGKVFAELAEFLPRGSLLYAGNSMPVRDLDTFFPGNDRSIRFLANRGASGIDGVVSSALGASAAVDGPLVLVIGDQSFYHDSNGLLAAKQHGLDATIVLLNNDGGGIFNFLPQAARSELFEKLFGTPHGLDFRPLAKTYGARFDRATSWDEFRTAVCAGIDDGGLCIVEVATERTRNVTLHREMWLLVSEAIARADAGGVGAFGYRDRTSGKCDWTSMASR